MSSHESGTPSPNSAFVELWQGLDRSLFDEIQSEPVIGLETSTSSQSITAVGRVRNALTLPSPEQQACMVPGCPFPNCNLGTHQKYNTKATQGALFRARQEVSICAASRFIENCRHNTPSSDGIDELPALPIEETLDPSMRSLFHFFFTHTFDKLALLFRGPAVRNLASFKERMLATALTSPAYCRSLILLARTEQDLKQDRVLETKEVLKLYNCALISFRELLASIRKSPHPLKVELALLVICILKMYTGVYGHEEGQRAHWQGLRNLVAMRGGMHCVTVSLAYVLHTDRSCAVMVEAPPTYINKPTYSLPMPALVPGSEKYRAAFCTVQGNSVEVDALVLDHLADVSGLVKLWEETTIQDNSKRGRTPSVSSEYLYYVRDRLDEQFAILNAQWAKKDTIEKCLLWTSRIVEYPCTWSNYVQYITQHHCHKLTTALQQQQNLHKMFMIGLDAKLWMSFALAVVGSALEIHSWAIAHLRELLDEKYGKGLRSDGWRVDEQENLFRFGWSNSYCAERFEIVCHEIEQ